jgi:transcriptional regulator with XRE-family HTH domain
VDATKTSLGRWLRQEARRRDQSLGEVAVYAGVTQATLSHILTQGYVPKVDILCRLADYFGTPRAEVLRLVGYLPPLEDGLGIEDPAEAALIRELVREFRQVPDEWKPVVIEQMGQFRRLAALRPVHLVGDEED